MNITINVLVVNNSMLASRVVIKSGPALISELKAIPLGLEQQVFVLSHHDAAEGSASPWHHGDCFYTADYFGRGDTRPSGMPNRFIN